MSEATTGVAHANARVSTMPKLSPPSDGADQRLRREQLARQLLLRQEAEQVDRRRNRCAGDVQADGERVGADDAQPGAGTRMDVRPGAEQHGQALARLVAADEDERCGRGSPGSACGGMSTPFGITS